MITRETDYAIRALLRLALLDNDELASTTTMAEEMEIPYRFLRRILLKLVERGLVMSVRGKQGGLRLAHSPEQITLLQIIQAIDPEAVMMNICLSDEDACSRAALCVVHEELKQIQHYLTHSLGAITLAALAERHRARCL